MTVGREHEMTRLDEIVVGLDGSDASAAALRWAVAQVGATGRVHAVGVVDGDDRPELDLVRTAWVPAALGDGDDGRVEVAVLEGAAPEALIGFAREVGADAVVVGHHARPHFGPRLVGHVTAALLHAADRPVVIVPTDWEPASTDGRPVAVGVGSGTEAAVRWAMSQPAAHDHGLLLVHAVGPGSLFRPDGWLDVLAYHLDPTVLHEWFEEDLVELADRVSDETGVDVDVSVLVRPGRAGAVLLDAGGGAGMLVVGRSEPAFVRAHIAAYLRHAIVHAPCPVVVVPAG